MLPSGSDTVSCAACYHLFHRQRHSVEHRGKQIALVLEMPVDRAAGHPGSIGDVGERGACHAVLTEYVLRRIQYPIARFQCLLLFLLTIAVSSCSCRRLSGKDGRALATDCHGFVSIGVLYIHSRMYVNCGACNACLKPELLASRNLLQSSPGCGRVGSTPRPRTANAMYFPGVECGIDIVSPRLPVCAGRARCANRLRQTAAQSAAGHPPPPEVNAVTVQPRDVPVTFEYVGQTAGVREVEVRPRVTGILERWNYREGAAVRAGDSLFTIDPAPFRAARCAGRSAIWPAPRRDARRRNARSSA